MLQPSAVGRILIVVALCAALSWTGSAAALTRVLAVGDFGVGGTTERDMGSAIQKFESAHPSDALVTLGDNDYTQSPRAFHRNWTASFGWLGTAGVSVAGTLGNHDMLVNRGRYEFDELNMPHTRYTRTVGNIEFFLLNSNSVNPTQTAWLEGRLAASTARWKIAVFHHPAWTCGGHRGSSAVVAHWVPLFEQYGVDLVVSGHDHNYQRFAATNGVRYLVHGGGGQELYAIEPCPASYPPRRFARAVHGFLFLRARNSVLRAYSVTRRGHIIDRVAIYP
jgi:predicted phosphodiesterase